MDVDSIFEPSHVRALFDEMAATYGIVNTIASFGFCLRWRQQCVGLVDIRPGMTVCDLMMGMAESWKPISKKLGGKGKIIGVDFSTVMCENAQKQSERYQGIETEIRHEDALENALPDESIDSLVSVFGLKTLSLDGKRQLAVQVARLLKPGGTFALLEISVPRSRFLRLPYLFYLRYCIPVIGRLFLGNPDNYRLLSVYTQNFADITASAKALEHAGLEVSTQQFFFGCASAAFGRKPGRVGNTN